MEEPARKPSERYILEKTIGKGSFAKVKRAKHVKTGEYVAIKIIDKAHVRKYMSKVQREIETLKTLNHPHICQMLDVFETRTSIFMVMEFCRKGDLYDYIVGRGRLKEPEARYFFRQILSAVSYIHSKGIAHRDIKPENILLDDSKNVKLTDFGYCTVPSGGLSAELNSECGSRPYVPPEVLRGEPYIGTKVDVWSLGVLLYTFLNGRLPFPDNNLAVMLKAVQSGVYKESDRLSEESKDIIRSMLQRNPQDRISVDQLIIHPWCQKYEMYVIILDRKDLMDTQDLKRIINEEQKERTTTDFSQSMDSIKSLDQTDSNLEQPSNGSILTAASSDYSREYHMEKDKEITKDPILPLQNRSCQIL